MARVVPVQRGARRRAARPARRAAAVAGRRRYLTEAGIGRLALDGDGRRYEYVDGPVHAELPVSRANGDTLAHLEREMERYLNGRFGEDGAPFVPLRFFVVDNGASFHLGVAYDHFIAGGDSVVALLKAIAARYDGTLPADHRPPAVYPRTYAALFARNARAFYVGQYLLPGMLLRARRAFRPLYPHGEDKSNAFTSFELSPQCTPAWHAPRRRGASRATISCWP